MLEQAQMTLKRSCLPSSFQDTITIKSSKSSNPFIFLIELIFILFTATNEKGLYNQFAQTEVQSGRLSKRQMKIVEKNLLREEKLKESRSYDEAP